MQIRLRSALLAALLSLTAAPALAQFPQQLPANSVICRLAIPSGGGPAQACPFRTFATGLFASGALPPADFDALRVTATKNWTTGSGMEFAYDGTEGTIQSFSNRAAITYSPIFYSASTHSFRISGTEAMNIGTAGNVGIGFAGDTSARLHVRPTQAISGAAVFSISSNQNAPVSGAPGPIQLTWGASAGSQWNANTGIPGNANMVTQTMFATKDTYDAVAWQNTAHLSGGTGSAIVGHRVQAYIDSTATSSRGGTGLETLIRNDTASGDTYGLNIGVDQTVTTTTGSMHGVEFDMSARGATVKYKFGVVVGSTQTDSAAISGTLTVNGFADTLTGSAAFFPTAFAGGSATGFAHGLMFLKSTGGAAPITENLVYGGGFTVNYGLNLGRMGFAQTPILIPNNISMKAFNAAGAAELRLIGLNTSNQVLLGDVVTIDPTLGHAVFGNVTGAAFLGANLTINGTAGSGFVHLPGQSAGPSTPAANATRLFANSTGALTLKNANGFLVTLATTANSADRGYTFPDSTGTIALIDVAQTITGAKTFGSAGSVGKLIVAGNTSGSTILNASATASGTLTLPAATDTLVGKATTDTFTNKTFDTAGTGNSFSINGVAATANTGTGAVARAAAPTFTTPVLGVASATSLAISGASGAGFLELASQASVPATGAANTPRLFANASGAVSFKNSNGFVVTLATASNTADRGYTFPDVSGTLALLAGTTTNDSAAAGDKGEFISSTVLVGSAVALTTNTSANVTSISLTAGDWDVEGNVFFVPNAATLSSYWEGWVHTVSATRPTEPNSGGMFQYNLNTNSAAGSGYSNVTGKIRISLASTSTIYLGVRSGFTVNTQSAYGFIGARRVR